MANGAEKMRIKVEVELHYKFRAPGPAILAIEAAGAFGQEISKATVDFGPVEHLARVPGEEGEMGMKVVHEKIWAARGHWKTEWDDTWNEMLQFYRSEEFSASRRADGIIMI